MNNNEHKVNIKLEKLHEILMWFPNVIVWLIGVILGDQYTLTHNASGGWVWLSIYKDTIYVVCYKNMTKEHVEYAIQNVSSKGKL